MKKATAILIALMMLAMSLAVQAAPPAEPRGNAFGRNGIRPGGLSALTTTAAMELRKDILAEKKQQKLDARKTYTAEEMARYEDAAATLLEEAPHSLVLEPGAIKMRGKVMKLDTPPVIKAGRTLVPVRAISEGLGATVGYVNLDGVKTVTITKEITRTVTAEDGTQQVSTVMTIVKLVLGSTTVSVSENGVEREIDLVDVTPGAVNGRTYVPLRFLAELFGLKTTYSGDSQTIDIEEPVEDSAEDSSDTDQAGTEPVETDPAGTEPVETDPAETEPAETDPAETEPADADPDTGEEDAGASEEAPAAGEEDPANPEEASVDDDE